jgi:5-hydroxyisourate hydrolase
MGRLSTHILDTANGGPAKGVRIELHRLGPDGTWQPVTTAVTNADGRTDAPLLIGDTYKPGTYQLTFYIGDYFRARGDKLSDPAFLDIVPLRFSCAEPDGHYHVPLLASPWSYSTYRGS